MSTATARPTATSSVRSSSSSSSSSSPSLSRSLSSSASSSRPSSTALVPSSSSSSSRPPASPSPAAASEQKARSSKRKHKTPKHDTPKKTKVEEDKKDKAVQVVQAAVPIKMIKDEELHCIVCYDFPAGGEIFQCKHGHLLCRTCHQSVIEGEKPLCPNCRVRLSRENPSRNRIAEMVLAMIMIDCPNKGCGTQHKFSEVTKHEKELCDYRPAQCKWEPLGCEWKGVFKDAKPHAANCPIRSKSAKKLLRLVNERNARKEAENRAMQDVCTRQAQVCQLLASRCRDAVMRDVHIEPDTITNQKCSKTFTALGLPWEAVLAPQPEVKEGQPAPTEPPRVGIFLRIVAPVKRRLIVKLFVLKGPSLLYDLTPSSYKIMFKRKKRKSDVFYLPFEPSVVPLVLGLDTINLRMGFVDISSGRVCRGFTSLNDGAPRSDEDESSETDYEYDDDGGEESDQGVDAMYSSVDEPDESDEPDDEGWI